jgi:hypothetical protein
MKQKQSGSKIINWHRPLGANEFRHRYLRARHADVSERAEEDAPRHVENRDEYWDYYDAPSDFDYTVLQAWNIILQGDVWGQLRALLTQAPWVADLQSNRVEEPPVYLDTWTAAEGIEARLADHLKQVENAKAMEGRLPSAIVAALQSPRDLEMLYHIFAEPAHRGLALNLLLFAPFWTRPLSQWVPANLDSQSAIFSLLEHLFVRYPVPKFLYSEWQGMPDELRLKWLCWFILLGQGRSLHRAAPLFGWTVARKFQHNLQVVPSAMSPTEACIYAEILRLGGSSVEFGRLAQVPAFIIDPTSVSYQPSYLPFWQQTVSWLHQQRDRLNAEQAATILQWAMHKYTEAERAGLQPFSWQGRSLQRVLELSDAYLRQISRPVTAYTWKPHGWVWEWKDEHSNTWSFTELCSSQALFAEGQALHHCVAGYAARCAAGYSAIVSLRRNELRQITIEINPQTKQLVQARGAYNCAPDVRERAIINQWMNCVIRQTPE